MVWIYCFSGATYPCMLRISIKYLDWPEILEMLSSDDFFYPRMQILILTDYHRFRYLCEIWSNFQWRITSFHFAMSLYPLGYSIVTLSALYTSNLSILSSISKQLEQVGWVNCILGRTVHGTKINLYNPYISGDTSGSLGSKICVMIASRNCLEISLIFIEIMGSENYFTEFYSTKIFLNLHFIRKRRRRLISNFWMHH